MVLHGLWKRLRFPGYIALTAYLWLCGWYLDQTRYMTVIDTCLAVLSTIVTIDFGLERWKVYKRRRLAPYLR